MQSESRVTICARCRKELQVGDWPFCDAPGGHGSIYPELAQPFSPVVVHRDAAGNLRFPAHVDAPVPEGFQKVELTNIHQIRLLESEVNKKGDREALEFRAHERAHFEQVAAQRHEALREAMKKMTPRGRKFAEMIMEQAKNRPASQREQNARAGIGFHVDAFSNDSSNREAYRDSQTDWKRRKD